MNITDMIMHRFQARYPVIWLESFDDARVYHVLKGVSREEDYNLYRWNQMDGLVELGLTLDTILPVGDLKLDAQQMLSEMLRRTDSYDKEIFVMEGMEDLLQYPDLKVLIKKVAREMPDSRVPMHLVFLSPEANIPYTLGRYIDVLEFPECELEDYHRVLQKVSKMNGTELSESLTEKLVEEAKGLTTIEAERIFFLAAVETSFDEGAIDVVRREKARIEKKLNILGAER